MIDNKTIRKVIMLNKMLPSGSPTYEDREASGAVANFTTNTVKPFVKCECTIDATESGVSTINVEQTGANLIDPSTIEVSGTIQVRFFREENILLKKGVTYKFVYLGTNQATLYFAQPVSGTYAVGTGKVLAFTPSEDCYAWLQALNLQGIETESNKFVLTCDGSEPTTYAPYSGTTTTVTLEETAYGGSVDVIAGSGQIIDEHGDLVYTLFEPVSISALEGVNNVWTDSGNTKVTYKYKTGEGGSSTKKYLPIFYDFYGKDCRHL